MLSKDFGPSKLDFFAIFTRKTSVEYSFSNPFSIMDQNPCDIPLYWLLNRDSYDGLL